MPAVADYPFVRTQFMDYSFEKESVKVNVGPITLGTIAGLLTQIGAWNTALGDVTFGTITQEEFGVNDQVSNARPVSKYAQVETRMLVGYVDAVTGAPDSFHIPTVDYDKFNYGFGDGADSVILAGDGATDETVALITALQAMAKFPGTNNAITVTYMKIVR